MVDSVVQWSLGIFFFYVVLSIAERKRVESPAVIEEWSIYLFSCISFCFIYFEDLLSVCTFVIGMFSWCMNFDKTLIMNLLFLIIMRSPFWSWSFLFFSWRCFPLQPLHTYFSIHLLSTCMCPCIENVFLIDNSLPWLGLASLIHFDIVCP